MSAKTSELDLGSWTGYGAEAVEAVCVSEGRRSSLEEEGEGGGVAEEEVMRP